MDGMLSMDMECWCSPLILCGVGVTVGGVRQDGCSSVLVMSFGRLGVRDSVLVGPEEASSRGSFHLLWKGESVWSRVHFRGDVAPSLLEPCFPPLPLCDFLEEVLSESLHLASSFFSGRTFPLGEWW